MSFSCTSAETDATCPSNSCPTGQAPDHKMYLFIYVWNKNSFQVRKVNFQVKCFLVKLGSLGQQTYKSNQYECLNSLKK